MGLRLELKGVILGDKWGLDEYRPGTRRERAPRGCTPLNGLYGNVPLDMVWSLSSLS